MLNADASEPVPEPASGSRRVDARGLRLTAADNVATMLSPASAGDHVAVHSDDDPNIVVVAVNDVPVGHKIAVTDVPSGAEIRKYAGEVIGIASQDIHSGEHVHEHNVRGIEPGGHT